MTSYLSLLRGINVGGQKKIKMSDLKQVYESLALQQVTTYIQSGNVMFSCKRNESTTTLSALIGNAIQEQLGLDVPVVLRTVEAMQQTITQNPFTEEALTAPDKLVVMFAASAFNTAAIENVKAKADTSIRFAFCGNTIFCFYPDDYGKTKWPSTFFEKQLGTTITARNWTTTCKLAELLSLRN